jgi:hypothetical protein
MNNVAGRQPKPLGNFRLASITATQQPTAGQQLGTGASMDRTIDTPATEQAGIGGVDDSIHGQSGDIPL